MSVTTHCLMVAWIGVVAGLLSGAVIGLRFAEEEWLGGYRSWRRRLMRLGHIACIGTGLLCGAYGVTAWVLGQGSWWVAISFTVGVATMPTVCFLSAWRQPCRHLFVIPVLALMAGTAGTLLEIAQWTSPS